MNDDLEKSIDSLKLTLYNSIITYDLVHYTWLYGKGDWGVMEGFQEIKEETLSEIQLLWDKANVIEQSTAYSSNNNILNLLSERQISEFLLVSL